MRERLRDAPWWAWAVIQGLLFGTCMWVWHRISGPDTDPVIALVSAVLAGTLFGLFMGRWTARTRREMREAGGDSRSPSRDRALMRSVLRGRPPQDPAERAAAIRLARYWLATYERQRRWGPLFLGGMTLLAVHLAVTDSAWWWLAAAFFAVMLGGWWWYLLRLRRRVGLLEDDVQV